MGRRWKAAIPSLDLVEWLAPASPGEPTNWKLYRTRQEAFLEFIQTLPGDPIYLDAALERFLRQDSQDSKIPPIVRRGRRAAQHVRDDSQGQS